jgi:hypothetical protein
MFAKLLILFWVDFVVWALDLLQVASENVLDCRRESEKVGCSICSVISLLFSLKSNFLNSVTYLICGLGIQTLAFSIRSIIG